MIKVKGIEIEPQELLNIVSRHFTFPGAWAEIHGYTHRKNASVYIKQGRLKTYKCMGKKVVRIDEFVKPKENPHHPKE
jgi:hypothetical protein